ncbi:MAG: hypothetical protein N2171_02255 [Clostridia bacterium]|nr:hypothetical protein [Clostridia bacterium]
MCSKIGVIADRENNISSLENGSLILIFEKKNNSWSTIEKINYHISFSSDLTELRDNIRSLILRLGDCRVIAGKTVSGLAYSVFNRIGLYIFEAPEISDRLFDDILTDIQTAKKKKTDFKNIPKEPISINNDGTYFLDLVSLQKAYPEVSSKKALQNFVMTSNFCKLDLICHHMPPWLESILEKKRFTYELEKIDEHLYKAIIYKKGCDRI